MRAYSEDLRQRVVEACDEGVLTREEIADHFAVKRTKKTLINAIERALRTITSDDCRGFFQSVGITAT